MHWEAMLEAVWRCSWRPRSSELRDALCGHDQASLEMQLETENMWTQICIKRPWSREYGDVLGGHDRVSLEMNFAPIFKRGWRCNFRLRLSELRDIQIGCDRVSLDTQKDNYMWCVTHREADLDQWFIVYLTRGTNRSHGPAVWLEY